MHPYNIELVVVWLTVADIVLSIIGKWETIGGFGERSWRYSAVFNDMKIEKLFLEVIPMYKCMCVEHYVVYVSVNSAFLLYIIYWVCV